MSFRLVLKSVTLNDLELRNCLPLRHFTKSVYDVIVKKFTFAMSSPDEFLVFIDQSVGWFSH